jgi:hypothetical protein
MIDVKITGLAELDAGLKRIVPNARSRINGGALRDAAEAIAQEGNRRIHSPRGHARTFKVYINKDKAKVTPGSRANFFSQLYRPVLTATINATRSRLDNLMHKAVETGTESALRG